MNMKKVIFEVLKRIIVAICLIYAFDLVGNGLQIFIPINFFTISIVSLLGISGLLSLIALFFAFL